MRLSLSAHCALKRLEEPSVYDLVSDELYELDEEAFEFLRTCASKSGAEAERNDLIDYCLDEGILTDKAVSSRRAEVIPSPSPSPTPSLRYLELQITRRCNLNCRHCYLGPSRNTDLSYEDIKRVLEEFESMQGLRVLVTGGEPILHPEFERINELLGSFRLRSILFTNGFSVPDETLKNLKVHEIQISIDGLEAAHDSLRGKGSFRRAVDTLKRAQAKGFEVSVSTMVHTGNLRDFDEMDSMFRDLGIRDWTVDIPCVEGNLAENRNFYLSPEDSGKLLEYGFGEGLHGGGTGYSCGHHLMSVTAEGKCAKCAFYEDTPVGDIREGLYDSWMKVEQIPLLELECDCDVLDLCRGGCRYRAQQMSKDLSMKAKDLYRCVLYGKI